MKNHHQESCGSPHMVIFPFMSKGHTIPLLQFALLLRSRGLPVTVVTTPANRPFISQFLAGADCTVIELPFPEGVAGMPAGIESTDRLPSMSLFVPFVNATKQMQPSFEEAIRNMETTVSCLVSDGFLPWTLQSASRFGIPRIGFYGMSYYSMAVCADALANGLLALHESDNEPFTLVDFPWIKLTRNDFDEPFNRRDPTGPHFDLILESTVSMENSYGILMNSYELEKRYADVYAHTKINKPKLWTIGPLCLVQQPQTELSPPKWMHWLDQQWSQGLPALYVAFGTQARVSAAQLREIALGLEESRVAYLWVVKKTEFEHNDGIAGEVVRSQRGLLVHEWVDQREILEHPGVQGFLSHCGWNSVLEGICAEVPILAWPMMAEQFVNAKMVTEEIKVGLRVNTVDGSAKGFVTGKSLKETVVQLMEGETGINCREEVKKLSALARKATAVDGRESRETGKPSLPVFLQIAAKKDHHHCRRWWNRPISDNSRLHLSHFFPIFGSSSIGVLAKLLQRSLVHLA